METCKERTVFLHITYDWAGQSRGATFVYVLGNEGDKWSFLAAYFYPLAGVDSAVEAAYLEGYASYKLTVPVNMANGHAVYETVVCNIDLSGLQFVSEYYDKKGNRYTLGFSLPYEKGAAGILSSGFYEAEKMNEPPSKTAYAEIWADWEWENDTPFVQSDLYPEFKRFFEYY
ncbi:hypothetical protein SDC9_191699 [bioreactor metagenome]|uniref:Uncharacterized protein n=1 Tax=bioreactor metagenome TaxID=1076179 RepID=A0A645HYR1_9ZZZZ